MNVNITNKKTAVALALFSLSSTTTFAALHDRGNGLIYDDVLDVTWMQDSRFPFTSNNPILYFNWTEASEYAENFQYQGFDDWRLPDITYGVENGDKNYLSELEYMFEVNLGNPENGNQDNTQLNASFIDGTTG